MESHLEELVLIFTDRETTRYNCSERNVDEWYTVGVRRLSFAVYYFSSGLLFHVLALPVLYVMLQRDLYVNSCYKIMFFIGIIECTEIWGVSFWPAYSVFFGTVYCTNPKITTFFGKLTMVQWLSGTVAVVLLGINRIADVKDAKLLNKIFRDRLKVYLMLLICLLYGIYGSIFYDTILFNSLYMAPMFDPLIGSQQFEYASNFLSIHNISISILLLTTYSFLCFSMRNKWSSSNSFQKHVMMQSVMISVIYSSPAILFVVFLYFTNPPWLLVIISDISYQLSGGLPFLMYILMNRLIRNRIFKLSGMNKYVTPANNQLRPSTTFPSA